MNKSQQCPLDACDRFLHSSPFPLSISLAPNIVSYVTTGVESFVPFDTFLFVENLETIREKEKKVEEGEEEEEEEGSRGWTIEGGGALRRASRGFHAERRIGGRDARRKEREGREKKVVRPGEAKRGPRQRGASAGARKHTDRVSCFLIYGGNNGPPRNKRRKTSYLFRSIVSQ